MSEFKALKKTVRLQTAGLNYEWGNLQKWVLFAGPDIIEDEGMVTEVAQELKVLTTRLGVPWILKCSFDKANRGRGESFRGPGMKTALAQLGKIKSKVGCALLTDVHETIQVDSTAEVADVLQVPAFLCRQTDLIQAIAKTNKVVHIKKGQFMAPWDMQTVVDKCLAVGNDQILLCERGTTFGYNRLINDMTGLVEMRKTGQPVVMDISHSTQQPGAAGGSSGGAGHLSPALARAAMAVGVDGIFCETHPNPTKALSDAATSLPLSQMENLLQDLNKIWSIHK